MNQNPLFSAIRAHAKVGILLGSALSASLGALLIRAGKPRPSAA
jgi:Na+/H+ antiporter NhaA